MNRIRVAEAYSEKYFEIERPSPLTDKRIESLIQDVLSGNMDRDISDQVYENFKNEMTDWIFSSTLNSLRGFDKFDRIDIINGCTQFIDSIYINNRPQFISGDYRYHNRLGNTASKIGSLNPSQDLIIAMPFPSTGTTHTNMSAILDEALKKEIDVHIDGAWLTCCRDIDFDVSHPAIKSVGISLSKGLGLGWNRIGLRWSRDVGADSISIMNDFSMNNRALSIIGLHFIRNLPADYLWNTYGKIYYKICKDFDLVPTNAIHLALKNNSPVGLSPLIRYVAEQ